jgi:CubicO group peptidase (beta-lactamase class C family)
VLDGVRVLTAASVTRMTTDQLRADQRAANELFLGPGGGWGLGLAVPAADVGPGAPARIGWDGGSGTTWRTDVRRGLTGILFTQRGMASPEPPPLYVDFWKGVDAAFAR